MPLVQDIDDSFERRAQALIEDAKRDALRNTGVGQSVKGYLFNANFKEKLANLAAKMGSGMGSALATAAVMAAGASAAAVTFGIGPVIGLALGQAVQKAVGEAKYQIQTKALREGIAHSQGGDSIADPALIEAGMAKVARKLDRVLRRHSQLSGGAGGFFNTLRHARTAIRGKMLGALPPGEGFPGYYNPQNEQTHDTEINRRLFELNYYAQMLGNFVTAILDGMIEERDRYVDYADLVYAHVLRQVHFTGNHQDCGTTCYSMPTQEFEARVNQLAGLSLGNPQTPVRGSLYVTNLELELSAHSMRSSAWQKIGNTEALIHTVRMAQGATPDADDDSFGAMAKGFARDKLASTRNEGDVERYSPALDLVTGRLTGDLAEAAAGQGFLEKTGGQFTLAGHELGDQTRAAISGSAALSQLGSGAVSEGLGAVLDEVKSAARNQLLKRAVLKKRDRAFNLLTVQQNSRDEAALALDAIVKGADILSRADRVAQKIAWYVDKIHQVESEFKTRHLESLSRVRNFDFSSFATCKDAWSVARALHYLFKQYEKAITFLVYMEIILVEIDKKVAKELRMNTGFIYDPGMPMPPRPRHMAAVESDDGPGLLSMPTSGGTVDFDDDLL